MGTEINVATIRGEMSTLKISFYKPKKCHHLKYSLYTCCPFFPLGEIIKQVIKSWFFVNYTAYS
jgi:hypothetical protein